MMSRSVRRRQWSGRGWIIGATMLLSLLVPSTATAHAFLLRSDPAAGSLLSTPPHQLHLWFSEPIDLPPHALQLFGPDGHRRAVGTIAVATSDATELVATVHWPVSGTYTVLWSVISADTHPVAGSFTLSVGHRSAHPTPPITEATPLLGTLAFVVQVLGRLLTLAALALLAGPLALTALLFAPAVQRDAPAALTDLWRRTRRLYDWGLAVALLSSVVQPVAQALSISLTAADLLSEETLTAVGKSHLGILVALRLLLILLLAGVRWFLMPPNPQRAARALWYSEGLTVLLALSVSMGGHAATTEPVVLSLALDVLHLAAMALWVGGLIALVAILLPLLHRLSYDQRHAIGSAVVPPFSALAIVCLLLLSLTGLYSALHNLTTPLDLLTTPYGQTLALKLALGGAVVAIGAVQVFVARPALARLLSADRRSEGVWHLFSGLLRGETLIAAALLLIVGVLSSLPPVRQPTAGDSAASTVEPVLMLGRTTGTLFVMLRLYDADGLRYGVTVQDELGKPLSGARLRVTLSEATRGQSSATLRETAPGVFDGGSLGDGTWVLQAAVTVHSGTIHTVTFALNLPLQRADAILRRAERTSSALRSAVEDELVTGAGLDIAAREEFVAPDRHYYLEKGVTEEYDIGRLAWRRVPGERWFYQYVPAYAAFTWPGLAYRFTLDAATPYTLRQEPCDGQICDVVSWWHPWNNASDTWWIGQRDGLPHREERAQAGNAMIGHLHSFNTPLRLVPPTIGH